MKPKVSVNRLTAPASVALLISLASITAGEAAAQVCPGTTLTSELRRPMGMALSNQGHLIVSETGTAILHSGRISILRTAGNRQTLIDGLPSALNDVAEPSGPAGIVMRGRTLYVLIGIGDSVLPATIPTRHLANAEVSSPIYSSVLAIHFSAHVENSTAGFTLSLADQQALAARERVILSNGGGDTIEIELVTDFPDYVPDPLPGLPQIVRGSNPFGLALAGDSLYVTDGGRNLVWAVDLPARTHSSLATFAQINNPLFPVGPAMIDAVPTGITYADGHLLVTLFRGVPFAAGTSAVVQIDPSSGLQTPLITGLKTTIGVLQIGAPRDPDHLVLQHSSGFAPFFMGPGVVLAFETPGSASSLIVNCLTRPTAMLLDQTSATLYVTEMLSGRLVAFQLGL